MNANDSLLTTTSGCSLKSWS